MFSHAYRGFAAPSQPRFFDKVDTVTGTSEADTVFVLPRDLLDPVPPPKDEEEIRVPGRGTAPKKQPQFATQSWEWWDAAWDDHVIRMGVPIIVDESTDSKVDILVYQEKERANYLKGFQAPTARSYTYIEDFEPIEDEIIVGGIAYTIKIDENDIPMFTDDIQPANWLNPCNEDGGDCFYL